MQHDEELELEQLKDWWQRNGRPIVLGLVVAAVLVLAWQSWHRIKSNRQDQASALYSTLLGMAMVPKEQINLTQIANLGNELDKNYSNTIYGQYGRLVLARVAVDQGQLADAVTQLKPVADSPLNPVIGELARERLARVLASQGKPNDALALLGNAPPKNYLAAREELRGDLLMGLDRKKEALDAYHKAKAALGKDANGHILQMKLDNLGDGDA